MAREHVPWTEPPLRFTRIGEGQSNLTFRVEDAKRRTIVVRRPPLGAIRRRRTTWAASTASRAGSAREPGCLECSPSARTPP